MASKEIAQPQKLSYFVETRWHWGIFDCFKFVCTWFNALFGKSEAKVRHLFASKNAFLQVDFDVVLHQSL
jgi:hypothetical protein